MHNLFDTTARAITIDTTENEYGHSVEVPTEGSVFPCRIQALSAREILMSGSKGVEVTHKMWCVNQSFTEKDRLLSSGATYEVTFVGTTDRRRGYQEILLLEIRNAGR